MKKSTFLRLAFLVNLLMINYCLDAQNWNWFLKGKGLTAIPGQSNTINAITQDASGDIYITGSFRDTLILDEDTLISTGFNDAFAAKYDILQNLIWVKQMAGSGVVDCKGLDIDNFGNVILGGSFQGDFQFESSINISSTGTSELFLLWLDYQGNLIQYEVSSGVDYAEIFALEVNQTNDILITGNFFGNLIKDNVNISTTQGQDFFCIKVKQNGLFEWGVQSTGGGNLSSGISLDSENNIYLTGSFEDGAEIGDNLLLSVNGNHNMFVTKYTTNGTNEWVYTITGMNEVHGNNIHVNSNNTIGIVGEFRQTAEVGIGPDTLIQSEGNYDILLLILSKDGDYKFAHGFGGLNDDIPTDITADFYGNFVITGKFGHNAEFVDTAIFPVGTANTFIAKINQEHLDWIKSIPGTGLNEGNCLYYGQNEKIYLGGTIRDSIFPSPDTLVAESKKDFYLAELSDYIDHSQYLSIFEIKTPPISLFPNPCQGSFTLETNQKILQTEIYNINGQLVHTKTINSFNYTFSGELNPGIYILNVQTNQGWLSSKLVVSY